MTRFAEENGFIGWFETSAKTNWNVDNAFHFLVENVIKLTQNMNVDMPQSGDPKKLNVIGKEKKQLPPQEYNQNKRYRCCADG